MKTAALVETIGGKSQLFFLPPYSPDRNPGELAWKHPKADTVGRMADTSKDAFQRKVRSSMRQLQNDPKKNPLLPPETLAQICRLGLKLLMGRLIHHQLGHDQVRLAIKNMGGVLRQAQERSGVAGIAQSSRRARPEDA